MNFKDLKSGYPLYIFDKNNLSQSKATVSTVSMPHVDAKMGGVSSLVVDVTIDGGVTFVVVSDAEVAYPDGKVISTDVQHIIREVCCMLASAEQAVAQVDKQRSIADKCRDILSELDPSQREKRNIEERFAKIEESMSDMMKILHKLAD